MHKPREQVTSDGIHLFAPFQDPFKSKWQPQENNANQCSISALWDHRPPKLQHPEPETLILDDPGTKRAST